MRLNQKGFTLLEVMVAVSLLGILLISAQAMLRFGILDSVYNEKYYEYKIQARYAMNRIIREIKSNVGATYDDVNNEIKASDGVTVLINANPTNITEEGGIFYYFDPQRYGTGDGYGELRGQNSRVIAKYIKNFTIEPDDTIDPTHKLLKITINCGAQNARQLFEFSTYVRLY